MYKVETIGRNGGSIIHEFDNIYDAKAYAKNHLFDFFALTDADGAVIYTAIKEKFHNDGTRDIFFVSPTI